MLTTDKDRNKEIIKELLEAEKFEEVSALVFSTVVYAKGKQDEGLEAIALHSFEEVTKTNDWKTLKQRWIVMNLLKAEAEKNPALSLSMGYEKKCTDNYEKIRKLIFSLEDFSDVLKVFGSKAVSEFISVIPKMGRMGSSYSTTHLVDRYEKLLVSIKASSLEDKDKFFEDIVLSALQSKNFLLLQAIYTQIPSIYDKVNKAIHADPESVKSSQFMFEMINRINTSDIHQTNPNVAVGFMADLVAGMGANLTNKSGLLYFSAKYEEQVNANVVVISGTESKAFFEFLAKAPIPCKIEFVITGTHWVSGQASVDKDGKLELLIVDPLGWSDDGTSLNSSSKDIVSAASQFFKEADFFVAKEKKQHAKNVCSFFTLDDAVHLKVVDKYLDKQIYKDGLFDFLKKNTSRTVTYEGAKVNIAGLPLYLLRTAQTTSLFDLMGQKRKGEEVLNKEKPDKKVMTPAAFVAEKPSFVEGSKGKLQNQRLNEKLEKMVTRCFNLVIRTDPSKLEAMMSQFTLAGLQQKLPERKKESEEVSKTVQHKLTLGGSND